MHALFKNLDTSIQPFRPPDQLLSFSSLDPPVEPQSADWVKNRVLAGYNLVQYRTSLGSQTIALNRGPLTPFKSSQPIDFPPSDFGSDLAILDPETGVLDLSFQMAWEIGKLSMAADRVTAGALLRLRRECHINALTAAKKAVDETQSVGQSNSTEILYMTREDAFNRLESAMSALGKVDASTSAAFDQRWVKSAEPSGRKARFGSKTTSVSQAYKDKLGNFKALFSRAVPE